MPSDFEQVSDVSEIPKGTMKLVQVGPDEIRIANVDGIFYALKNRCTHMGGPLAKGELQGYLVQCLQHGSKFDVRTGAVVVPPARTWNRLFK